MRMLRLIPVMLPVGLLLLAGVAAAADGVRAPVSEKPTIVTDKTENNTCLDCHGIKGFAVPEGEFGEGPKRNLFVLKEALHDSVHTEQSCVDCHNTIEQIPHKTLKQGEQRIVQCVQCHEKQSLARKQADRVSPEVDISRTMVGLPPELKILEQSTMEKEAGHYLASIHAQPREDGSGRINATCADCHGTHDIVQMKTADSESFRLNTPQICGRCHEKELKDYTQSVHGAAVKRHGKLEAAVCSDCHSAHQIASPEQDQVKLAITENCGSCHEEEVKSYRSTYHGQVAQLGYAHTAKCADCHAAHNTRKKDNPDAQVYPDNLVKTCKECHKQATASFVKFQPHGNTHDFKRFPAMWITSKFMITLLAVVFLFFWGHSLLWFKRESKEPKHTIMTVAGEKYVMRFPWQMRLAHLLLAIAVMVLALTGTTVLYADSYWAPTVMKLLGGPKVAAIIHRMAATLFGILFFGHILGVLHNVY
ncbi:MAG TPA: cytochrome C, partial [Gammaproteobacteria bacterium]|nr:cytochrome C [Gammaproteobacteria bacterium]